MSDGLKLLASIVEHGSTSSFRDLSTDLFVDTNEREVYEYIRQHYRRYSSLPTISTVEDDAQISLPNSPEKVAYYLQRVQDRSMFNVVRPIWNELREALVDTNPEHVRQLAFDLSAGCRTTSAVHDLRTLGDMSQAMLDLYERNHLTFGISGIPTGFPPLDRETDGFQNGDLITLVARLGIGKTHLLIHMAKTAWMRGRSVLFVSMEMTLEQIANRFYAQYARVNPDCVRKGQLGHYAKPKWQRAVQELSESHRLHLFAGNMGKRVEDIDGLIQEINPDIIYIDGMYLMTPSSAPRTTNRYEKVAFVLDELKRATIERNRPIVATTQFSRDAGKGGTKGSLESIGFTDAIGTHSSIVISATTPEDDNSPRPRTRVIEVLKGREGEVARFTVNFGISSGDFTTVGDTHRAATIEQNMADTGVEDGPIDPAVTTPPPPQGDFGWSGDQQ